MIDKSLRQHYRDGENVGPFEKGKNIIMSAIPSQQITPASIARNVVTRGIGKKLAGTGILSSLGPIGALLAMFLARKGMDFASKKWGEGGVQQALTSGFAGLGVGSPEEQRELRVLEKRRADMLQRKDEGKNYSENNLSMVTRSIAEAKGLDINNPNEMKNIDKDIEDIKIEKILLDEPSFTGEGYDITEPLDIEDLLVPIKQDPDTGDASIAERIAAEQRAAKLKEEYAFEDAKRAAQEKAAEEQRAVEEQRATQLAAEVAAAAAKRNIQQYTGGGGQQQTGGGGGAAERAGGGSQQARSGGASPSGGISAHGGWGWKKGGRVDKALGGRSRDI